MPKWEEEMFYSDIAGIVKSEYKKLLSVNFNAEEAEHILVKHFEQHFGEDVFTEGYFWIALSLSEWHWGRLTRRAKENAHKWIEILENDISSSARQSLLDTLNTPMPHAKKVRPPAYVSHCPWPVGSLLAYRISCSDHPHVTKSPFFGKYVLLRIVKINKNPITKLAPSAGWDERMLVGLYNWIGDAIPHPDIAKNLEFTAISVEAPVITPSFFQAFQIPDRSLELSDQVQQIITKTTTQRIETCCDLDWKCPRYVHRNDVFTYLTCDPSYETEIPSFFKTDLTDYSKCHCVPFDAVLVNRFYQITEQTDK